MAAARVRVVSVALGGLRRLAAGTLLSRPQQEQIRKGLAYAGAPTVELSGSVSPPARVVKVLWSTVAETTSNEQRVANEAAMAGLPEQERKASPLCLGVLPCAFAPWCKSRLVTYTPPQISVLPQVSEIPSMNFHALTFYLDGQITHQVQNLSQPGVRTEQVTEHCPGGKSYQRRFLVPGSADVRTSHVFQALSSEENALYAQVSADLTLPEAAVVTGTPSFKTTGILNVFWDLMRLAFTGTIKTHVSIPTTVSWRWRGQNFQQTYNYEADLSLPVRNVNWDWL